MRLLTKLRKALFHASTMDELLTKTILANNTEIERITTVREYEFLAKTSSVVGVTDKLHCQYPITVSLTSYGNRIHEVYLAIESLLQQTMKPNRIVLWLAENEFSVETIPNSLKKLMDRGLSIQFCEDLKSYKKLIPSLIQYPDDIIITADDDLIYKTDLIENLVRASQQNPSAIVFGGGQKIGIKNGYLQNYNNWNRDGLDYSNTKLNFPTGCTGILYPPHSLHSEVVNQELFLKLAPMADDVWFKAMSLLQKTPCVKIFTHDKLGNDFVELRSWTQQSTALMNQNVGHSKNDEQIHAVFSHYNLYDLLQCKPIH